MHSLISGIREIIQIGVKIGMVVELTNVTIIMMIIITGPTIRSIFVRLMIKVWM